MSCDGNTRAYCERAGARIAPALGVSPAEATELLLQVHELGTTRAEQALISRRDGGGQGAAAKQAALAARAADTAAEEATVEIFREMRAMIPQMDVPAHGDPHPEYGFALPKRPAQYGWKEVRDLRRLALEGARNGLSAGAIRERFSPLAGEVFQAQQAQTGANGGGGATPTLSMARRGRGPQTPPAILIEVEGQVIPITGSEFGTILTAIKALPGVDGRCFNADRDGRGKRWVVPGTRADVAKALHGYGMTVDGAAPPAGTQTVPIPQAAPAAPTVLGDDTLVAIANGATGAQARAYLDTQVPATWVDSNRPRPVQLAGMAYSRNRDHPPAQRLFAQALAESQNVARCPNCGQFQGQSAHNCPFVPSAPGAHQATSLNGWAQAIAMTPGVREVANGQATVDLSQPGPNATADTLFGAAQAVDRGALPAGVTASPALEQAARAWIASRHQAEAQTFAQALLAASMAPDPTPITPPSAAPQQGPRPLTAISSADFAAALRAGQSPSQYAANQQAAAQAAALGITPDGQDGAAPQQERPATTIPGAPAAYVRTTAPGWAHAILSAGGVRELADGAVSADAQQTVIVAAAAIAANLLPEGVVFSGATRAAAEAMAREPKAEHAAALVRALEDESNRAGAQVATRPVWVSQVPANYRTVAQGFVGNNESWLLPLASGEVVPDSADEVTRFRHIARDAVKLAGVPPEVVAAANAYLGNPFQQRASFARVLAHAALVTQCPDCGQFVGLSGHICQARAFDPNTVAAAIRGMHPAVAGALGENVSSETVAALFNTPATAAPNIAGALQDVATQLQGVLASGGMNPIGAGNDPAVPPAAPPPGHVGIAVPGLADVLQGSGSQVGSQIQGVLAGAAAQLQGALASGQMNPIGAGTTPPVIPVGGMLGPNFQAAFQAATDALSRGNLAGAAAALQGGAQPLSDDQMRTLFLGGGTLHPDGSMTAPDGSLIAPAGTFAQAAAGLTTPTVMPERDPNALLTALGLAPTRNGGSNGGDGGGGDDDAKGLKCGTCGQFMGREPHVCRPAWMENYPAELGSRADQFVRTMPGIVELANGSKPLGSGPHASTERRALETYATHMQEIGGVGEEAMKVAEAYLDQPYRNAQAFAAIVAIAAGTQKCPDCGQFMSATAGHECPARMAAVPTDEATVDWLGTLAGTDAVRNALGAGGGWDEWGGRGAGGSMSRGFSTSQRRLWDADDEDDGDDEEDFDDEDFDDEDFDDEDAGDDTDEYGISDRAAAFWESRDRDGGRGRDWWAKEREERQARNQAIIDAMLPTARDILDGNIADNAQVPTALYIAADAFDARPDIDNARLLASIIDDLSRGRKPRLWGMPSENRVTAWRAMRDAPDLPDLANGLVSFSGDDGRLRAALDEAAAALSVRDNLSEGLNDAVIDYEAQPARYAADLAGALCAAAGVQQCGKCGQFIGKTEHVCAVISANGKVYDQNGYDRDGYNRRGFNKDGFNKDGWDENGFNSQGLDKDGYNRAGFNSKGFRKDSYNDAGFDGHGYAADGRDEKGYDRQGLDAEGYDKNGFDASGNDRNGWDKTGRNAAGETHPFFVADARGLYGDGFNADGFDLDGYAADGRDMYGYDRNGIGPYGYDRWGFNAEGLDANGNDRGGYLRGIGPYGYDRTGYNNLGLDRNGYSFTGYDNDGKDRNGQERTLTVSPKTGKTLPAKYNQSGWDQFGYDRWGFSKKTGLTAPDAQGRQYNYCGWVYDAATERCVNPNNPAEWVPHIGWEWDKRPGGYLGWNKGYNGTGYQAPRVVPGARYAPPPPPNDPRTPPTFDAFKQGAPMQQRYDPNKGYVYDDTKVRELYNKLIAGGRKRSVAYRWLRSEQRLAEDPRAVVDGVPLRCPECGRFTGGNPKGHECPNFGNRTVKAYFSGVVRGGDYDLVLQTPHNPSYVEPSGPPQENVRQGYTQDPNDYRRWLDAEGYDFSGLDENGFDRTGYNKEGYNRFGYDHDGFDRRGYNKEGFDRDGNSRPLTLEVVANGLAEGQDPINNRHIAETFSRVATQIAGRPRRVVFKEPGSGFATDMQGKIFADPQPLGPDAPHAQQLVAIKAGIYHELGHEQFTPMDLWAGILDIMQSKGPQDVEVDMRFAGLGVQTVRLDTSRTFVKDAYNIVEDGRMERRVDDRYAGAGEILAADAAINPRWPETVRRPDGTPLPPQDVVPWALLYEALPFFNVRPSTYAKMDAKSRALFDELAPVVRAAVNGKPEDAWSAAVYMAARMEQEGVKMPDGFKGTDPGNPPPGTDARRPRIVIEGDQVIDGSQMQGGGGGGGGMDMDVEFKGHVTVKGQMPDGDGQGGGGQTIFSGGVTYEEEQQNRGRQYQPAQNRGQQNQQGQQNGQQGQQNGQQGGGQGQSGEQSGQQGGGSGSGQSGQQGQQSGQQGGGGGGGGQSGQQGEQSGQQGGGGAGGGEQNAQGQQGQQGGGGGGGDRQYQQAGQHGDQQGGGAGGQQGQQGQGDQQGGRGGGQQGQGEDDDTNGRGKGWRKGMGQGEDESGQGRQSGQGQDGETGQGHQPGQNANGGGDGQRSANGAGDVSGQQPGTRSNGSDVEDADMADYWKDWNEDSAQDAIGSDAGQQSGQSNGAGGRGSAPTRQGGSPFRDANAPFTKAQLADVLAAAEREAVSALDSGIRVESRVEVLGAALHQPLGNRSSAKQRYKTPDGRIEGVQVGMPRAGTTTVNKWKGRRPEHKKVAGRMATVLQAIRADVEKRLRNLPEGQLDRRRIVRAAAGQQNVRTQSKTLPQTSFRASVAVDLSGSMSYHIQSGALYDSMMVLGDTFELLDIPYESRGFGSTDAQFKAMDEPSFDAGRAAALTETNLGGTSLSRTAGLAVTALRGGEEANRLFVGLSDGQVEDQAQTATVLKDARKRGVVTFGIFLGHGANKELMDELWGAGNWTAINSLDEMPKAVGQRLAALFNRLAQR